MRTRLQPAIVGIVLFALALPAAAAVEHYAEDPNGLVPFKQSVMSVYSQGDDDWEVWICDVPNWSILLDLGAVTSQLSETITPYFEWLSGGDYRPVFRAGGTVVSNDEIPANGGVSGLMPGCEEAVRNASNSQPEGVVIIADGGYPSGYGTQGDVCPQPFQGCFTTFPSNYRRVVLGAGTVTAIGGYPNPYLFVVAHEIGHAIGWAHSYGGHNLLSNGEVNQYDNIVDIMSAGELTHLPIGTHAYNRYASGWLDPAAVAVYSGGSQTFQLHPKGGNGIQLIALPIEEGLTYALGLREASGWDAGLAATGVELYLVDTRPDACDPLLWWPDGYPCYGASALIAPVPPPQTTTDTSHVMTPPRTLTLGGWEVSIFVEGAVTYVRVDDGSYLGRFSDDDGNLHEANIEAIAEIGVTQGCNPPGNDRFCPFDLVSRAAMATFLVRSLEVPIGDWNFQGYFPDVAASAWYAPYVERLFELGITQGYDDGTFRPDASVTRAEMAVFITRAFELVPDEQAGSLFEDVQVEAWYAPHVGALVNSDVTKGCSGSPYSYCPDNQVPRDQMASFLARVLGIGS